ncbi:class I SAM-dependent methyltransferase [Geomesophilobacter sediminis]|uniref:Methyltransferase domain-containing protein n=1 Tax=Geomesophilobacter sediminis TaxID=2798584 RepID=A0A8J7M1L9_9BACT|nr:class I SAM-dependent methyltransferase [Geomesophilobacter sediminis]MBJ6727028.1 methyltransferase domain-containing protein [Geomesophilobacter sediminis]
MLEEEMAKKPVLERIMITREKFSEVESEIRFHEHLRRYAAVRRFCYGKVLDFASGCGYGSYLLSVNPEVEVVVGIDKDDSAIAWAKTEYQTNKTDFRCQDIEDLSEKFDTLVSLEAIEHFEDLSLIPRLAARCKIDNVIISYPNKKSSHFNPYHVQDFCLQDILNIMSEYICYHDFQMGDVHFALFVKKPAKAPAHIFGNLADLR